MDKAIVDCEWEEIHGFYSWYEYKKFIQYLESQKDRGLVVEVDSNRNHSFRGFCGGRWFMCCYSHETWRLIEPDPPFAGLWEKVAAEEYLSWYEILMSIDD